MNILFVCKGNVGRSQMAEAFYERYSKNKNVKSAGYAPSSWVGKRLELTQHVKACMDEEGINVREKISKKITEAMIAWADTIIVFDSKKDEWPLFLRNSDKLKIWEVDDPRHGDLETHRKARDEIKKKIKDFLGNSNRS